MPEVAVVRHTDNPITLQSIVKRWNDYPPSLDTPDGSRLVSPVGPEHLGLEKGPYRFVQIVRVDWDRPGTQFDKTSEIIELVGDTLTGTRVWTPWDQSAQDAEIAARKQTEIDDYLALPSTTIDYETAKTANGGTLTKAQFVTFVNNNWPEPTLEP